MSSDVRDELAAELRTHKPAAFTGMEIACACDRKWRLASAYREHVADALLPVVDRLSAGAAGKALREGYERGRRDFQFQPEGDNHHNAALCPYCTPSARAEAADGGTT